MDKRLRGRALQTLYWLWITIAAALAAIGIAARLGLPQAQHLWRSMPFADPVIWSVMLANFVRAWRNSVIRLSQ